MNRRGNKSNYANYMPYGGFDLREYFYYAERINRLLSHRL